MTIERPSLVCLSAFTALKYRIGGMVVSCRCALINLKPAALGMAAPI